MEDSTNIRILQKSNPVSSIDINARMPSPTDCMIIMETQEKKQ